MTEEKELENFYYDVLWTDKSPVPPVFDEFNSKEKKELKKDSLFKLYKRGVPVGVLKYVRVLQKRGSEHMVMKPKSAIEHNRGKLAGKIGYWLYRIISFFKR